MNEQNKILFERYGHHEKYNTIQLYIHAHEAIDLLSLNEIISEDKNAESTIQKLEEYIAAYKAHRIELANRYNELSIAPVEKVIRLKRERNSWGGGKVFYYLTAYDRIDGRERLTSNTKYEGKHRKEAFAAFEAYKKAHPGIIAEMDVEKARWEK